MKLIEKTDKPINKIAAFVTSTVKPENHFWHGGKTNQIFWDHKPETYKFRGPKKHDITGKKFGRMVVVGYFGRGSGHKQNKSGCLWVVRCGCGRFELKRTKAIKNKKNGFDCCDACRKLELMVKSYNYHTFQKQLNFSTKEK